MSANPVAFHPTARSQAKWTFSFGNKIIAPVRAQTALPLKGRVI